jgi:hypothetical protein
MRDRLRCQIPVRLDLRPVIRLRTTTVIPQRRLACCDGGFECQCRQSGGQVTAVQAVLKAGRASAIGPWRQQANEQRVTGKMSWNAFSITMS